MLSELLQAKSIKPKAMLLQLKRMQIGSCLTAFYFLTYRELYNKINHYK